MEPTDGPPLTCIEPPALWILRELGYDSRALGPAEALLRTRG